MGQSSHAQLLQFLAPGFLHAMGNAFFAIQGHARLVFNDFERVGPQGEQVLGVCDDASRAIEIYRVLVDRDPPAETRPVGQLAYDVTHLLRAPLRDVGIKLHCDEDLSHLRVGVPFREFVLASVAAVRALTTAVPTGFRGKLTLTVDADQATDVSWQLRAAPGHLPFHVDLGPAEAVADLSLGGRGTVAQIADGAGLRITFPAPDAVTESTP